MLFLALYRHIYVVVSFSSQRWYFMETERPQTSIFDGVIDEESSRFLGETAKWAKALSVLSLILGGLMSAAGILIAIVGPGITIIPGLRLGPVVGIVYLCLGLVYLYPGWMLLQFASSLPSAMQKHDQPLVNKAFINLRNCFRFWGILSVVMIGLYLLVIFGSMVFSPSW